MSSKAKAATRLDIPHPTRVTMPAGYVPEGTKSAFLPWEFVDERLEKSHSYWICSTRPDGRPHAIPVWGVWVEGAVFFSTDPASRKARNFAANPEVVIHLESGDEAVILEGSIERPELTKAIDDAYNKKYGMKLSDMGSGSALFQLRPRVVMAWREKDFVQSATKWTFEHRR